MFFKTNRILIIGLDCATPELLFGRYLDKLPNIRHMVDNGISGRLHSSYPPITIPAWMVMHTGKTAGQLGLYGFRHRNPGDYKNYWIATSDKIKKKKIWDYLGDAKKQSIVVGIPPTYPVYPIRGNLISGFITPDASKEYTYPNSLKSEIQKLVGDYPFDVIFRIEDRDQLLDNLYDMSDKHFKVIEYLIRKKKWDFFTFIEIGLDRLHHAYWKYFDPEHHLYKPGNKYENVALNYYKYLDKKVGRILDMIPKNTTVITVSDHGAKRMKGCFCINEWLIKESFLKLKKYPNKQQRFEELKVDWKNTKVWGWGGYYARIFINKKGREPEGIVREIEYEDFRDKLIEKIQNIKGPDDERWNTIVHKPEEIYDDPQGEYPDLMVYFDDLHYRSAGSVGHTAGSVGHKSLFLSKNDTGPDDVVHDWNGIFIMYEKNRKAQNSTKENRRFLTGQAKFPPKRWRTGKAQSRTSNVGRRTLDVGHYNILDICPTVLDKFGLKPEGKYKGNIIK